MKNFLINLLSALKKPLLQLLEKEVTKIAIANLIKSPWLADFRIWAVTFTVEYLAEHFAKPIIDCFFRKVNYTLEVANGKYVLKEIQNSTSIDDWNSHIDRV